MDKKYTIFVSSTQEDLRDEREAVAKAILELGHIPVGMEMFSAADEQQWQLIQRQINQSDYYIVILAHRYGSMAGNVSYTEREYDYAVDEGVPVLAFIIEKDAPWPADRVEEDDVKRKRLIAFKDKVKSRMVSLWNNADQLNAKVLAALSKQFVLTPRPGWIRAIDVPGPEVLAELSRLSKENADLRARAPEFEIMFAGLLASGAQKEHHAHMIILIHYSGSPMYLPKPRYQMVLEFSGRPQTLRSAILGGSPLIRVEGEDLQIEGSGYVHLLSADVINPGELGDAAILKLAIRFRQNTQIELAAELHPPKWLYGEPTLDLASILPSDVL
jgi:hypothetical protein